MKLKKQKKYSIEEREVDAQILYDAYSEYWPDLGFIKLDEV